MKYTNQEFLSDASYCSDDVLIVGAYKSTIHFALIPPFRTRTI